MKITEEFKKSVITLASGQIIVHAVSFFVSFLITRLYQPEEIGTYSLFVTVTSVLALISSGGYDTPIVIEKDENKTRALFSLSVLLNIAFNTTLFFILLALKPYMLGFLGESGLNDFLLVLPFSILLFRFNATIQFFLNRHKRYKIIQRGEIIMSFGKSTWSVVFGVLKQFSGGLVIAGVISNIITLFYLIFQLPKYFLSSLKDSFSLLKKVAVEYKEYPTIYNLSSLLNALVVNGTPLFIVYFYSIKSTGYYFMAEKTIVIPVSLLSLSVSKVFYQKANELYRSDKASFLSFINQIQKKMFYLLLPFLILASVLAPYFFRLFGDGWEQAGEMVKYFAIYLFASNLISPVSYVANIIHRVDIFLYFNISLLLSKVGSFYLGSMWFGFEGTLLFASITTSFCYLGLDVVLKRIIKGEIIKGDSV